jgi:hypothetical protein
MLDIKKVVEVKYQMRVFLYMANASTAADEDGPADPYVIVRCAEKVILITLKWSL